MNAIRGSSLFLSAMLGLHGVASEGATITVAIYDYAEVPPSELALAQGEAARIFHEIGVGLKWLHYPVGSAEDDQGFLEAWRQTPDSLRLVLRIFPRTMAEGMGLSYFILGFAMPAAKGEFPRTATAFYHRAEELARLRASGSDETPAQKLAHRMTPLPMILGHLMAHEIGHLLLGRDGHSRSGIMSNPWSAQSLRLATAGKLAFGANEAKTIRDQVLARIRAADLTIRKITVLVYDYARVPAPELAVARQEAARILRQAEVGIEWRDYAISSPRGEREKEMRQGLAPTTLALRIVPRSMAERYGLGSLRFGFALPAPEGQFGSVASVFYHAAEELAAYQLRGRKETLGQVLSHRLPARAMILGHLMAHEIGHLLLGRDSHSRKGIMHVPWGRLSINRAASGKLLFSANEAQRIRAQVLARTLAGGCHR